MTKRKRVERKTLQKRWIRDFSAERQVYTPEAKAKPSRMIEGFELRDDGTYCDISSGADDALEEAEGTWHLDDDGMLALCRHAESSAERKLRIIEADEESLVVEE